MGNDNNGLSEAGDVVEGAALSGGAVALSGAAAVTIALDDDLSKDNNHQNNPQQVVVDNWDIVEFVLDQVQRNGLNLRYASPRLQQNKSICLVAVRQNGMALQYCRVRDQEVVITAIKQNPNASKWAPEY